MNISLRLTGWLGFVLLLVMAGCGTSNVGTIGVQDIQHNSSGVKLGGFEVVRYNAANSGATLNDSISLKLEQANGQQALIISVEDDVNTTNVLLDVRYDAAKVHPVRAQFTGLLGSEDQVIGASFLDKSGVAGVGQVAMNDFTPAALDGRFAVVTFAQGPSRSTSAAGGPYTSASVDLPFFNFGSTATDDVPNVDVETVENVSTTVTFTGGWQRGDGNLDGFVTVQDLTPIGLNFGKNVATQWTGLEADYNGDGVVSVQDLTTIGLHFQEGTSSFLVEVAADSGGGRTEVGTLDWVTDRVPATAPTDDTPGDPRTSVDFWRVEFTGSSSTTLADLVAIDDAGDDDGNVSLFITPQRGTTAGVTAEIELAVSSVTPIDTSVVNIEGFDVSLDDSGTETILDNGNAQADVVANGSYTFTLESISGSYTSLAGNGTFDGPVIDENDTAMGVGMTQEEYDQAFADATANAVWTVSNGGAAGLRTASCDWIVFAGSSPITGNPGTGTIFPDDDPESDASSPEGQLQTQIPVGTYTDTDDLEVRVSSALSLSMSFDVLVDENAVTLNAPTEGGNPITELTLQVDSLVEMTMMWGASGVPLDVSQTQLQLVEGETPDGCWVPLIDFEFNDEMTDPLDAGQFNVVDRGGGIFAVSAIVPGVLLNPGRFYHFRMNNTDVWNSLNKPAEALETEPPPPAEDLVVVPESVANVSNGGPNNLQVFFQNPGIRRDDRLIVDPFNESVTPFNEEGYNDQLKDGAEFTVAFQTNDDLPPGAYPQGQMIEGSDAEGIVWDDPANLDEQFIIATREPGRIVIDIAAIRPIQPFEGTVTFAFKLFNRDLTTIGQATFTKNELGSFVPPLVGVDWGVNAYKRDGQTSKTPIDFTDKSVEGLTVGTPVPDVVFCQFNGGFMFDPADGNQNNVHIYLEDIDTSLNQRMRMNLALTGITTEGDYLAMHVLTAADFFDGIGPGQLIPGQTYDVYLDYTSNPVAAYYFGDDKRLTVSSSPS